MVSDWLSLLEARLAEGEEQELAIALVNLALFAGQDVAISEEERHAAARRALLLLAAGGDPARGLDLHGRAVTAMADDLGTEGRRRTLGSGLADLYGRALTKTPHVAEAVRALLADPDVAWRAFAAALLAEELDR